MDRSILHSMVSWVQLGQCVMVPLVWIFRVCRWICKIFKVLSYHLSNSKTSNLTIKSQINLFLRLSSVQSLLRLAPLNTLSFPCGPFSLLVFSVFFIRLPKKPKKSSPNLKRKSKSQCLLPRQILWISAIVLRMRRTSPDTKKCSDKEINRIKTKFTTKS